MLGSETEKHFKPIMKNSLSISLLIIFSLSLSSCIPEIGKWDDNIKLSVREAEFKASGDSIVITTKGSWWWITDISVDTVNFYGFTGDNPDAEFYSIKQENVTVERRNKTTLFIKSGENPMKKPRKITVGLEAGDYFDRVIIIQKSE
jgi:hypothetical protein